MQSHKKKYLMHLYKKKSLDSTVKIRVPKWARLVGLVRLLEFKITCYCFTLLLHIARAYEFLVKVNFLFYYLNQHYI
jgi:hypothetical protein